jgi:hypothetical protein
MRKHDEAKPLVRETMMNLNNIITDSRRRQFHLRYITRLEDECIIAELISESSKPLDRKEVEIAAINLIRDSSDEKILELLSTGISPSTILRLQQVREYLSKEITRPSDIRALPAPADGLSRSKSGNRMIKIFGRVCWKTLCAEDSPIFKAWNGLLPERFSTAFLQEQ